MYKLMSMLVAASFALALAACDSGKTEEKKDEKKAEEKKAEEKKS